MAGDLWRIRLTLVAELLTMSVPMGLVVQKYGGSSLATPKHIQRAALRIKARKASGCDVIVVVSAMGRMTDHLIRLAEKTVSRPPQRELDMLLTAGERVSMALLAMALEELGIPAISFTGSQSGIVTSSDHTDAKIIDIRAHRIRESIGQGKVVIIAGFQGVSLEKEITTLGRGGSDTTAVAVAAALGAECCEILTDVDGLFTADPRLVPSAKLLARCSYDEGLELASLGAKMQARSLELAKRYQVTVKIASSANFGCEGTAIGPVPEGGLKMESTLVKGIATRDGYHFFRVASSLAPLVKAFASKKIPLRFFHYAQGETSFLCEKEKVNQVKLILSSVGEIREEVGKIAVVSAVGEGLTATYDLLPDFLGALEDLEGSAYLVCTNSMSISAAVPSRCKEDLAQQLHKKLIESRGIAKKEPAPKIYAEEISVVTPG